MDESITRHLEQQQLGKLKLSEAIRIGARMRPQCFGTLMFGNSTCVMGAALEGAGLNLWHFNGDSPRELFRKLFGVSETITADMIRRNDRGLTREQIADWLEAEGY